MKAMETMSDLFEDLEEDEEMVAPAQIGLMLVDWTDPSKAVYVLTKACSRNTLFTSNLEYSKADGRPTDESIHVDVAIDIVRALFDKEMTSK